MKERILIFCNRKTYWLQPDEICSLKGDGSYTQVYLANGEVLKVSKNMKTLMASFPTSCTQFLRVQKSYVVNINHIKMSYISSRRKHYVKMINDYDVPVNNKEVINKIFELYGSFINRYKPAKQKTVDSKTFVETLKQVGGSEDYILINV